MGVSLYKHCPHGRIPLQRKQLKALSAALLLRQGVVIGESTKQSVTFHKPTLADAADIHTLINRCPPLDVNSLYLYLLLCQHHSGTCVVVKRGNEVVGYVSGYIPPQQPDVLFIWQVAVDETARGQGLAGRMLAEVLDRPENKQAKFIETTISPSNEASQALFKRFAEKRNTDCTQELLFKKQHFGKEAHEEEVLFRIGPFSE